MKLASVVPWPESRLQESTQPFYFNGAFKLRFPKDPAEFIVMGEGDIVVRYARDRWIGVQLMTAAKARLVEREGARVLRPSALSYADLPRILYTKTPDDVEPAHIEDRRIWRSALISKDLLFSNATQLSVAERGPLTAHFSDGGVGGATGVAYVVHRQFKDSFLFLQAKGFSFDDVQQVIGSIEALRE